MALPALRNLDVSAINHDGETLICLRDQEGYVEDPVVLSPVAFFIASLLDGKNDVTDIQYHFSNESGGRLLREEDIRKVVAFLDEGGFLLTDRFQRISEEVIAVFQASDVRPAHLAGQAYPDEPERLRVFLDESVLGAAPPQDARPNGRPVRALVVPHIDFERGAQGYAAGYTRLRQGLHPGTVFVFGVAHAAPPVPFVLTRKDFGTPLGLVKTDQSIIERLATACDWDPFEYEIVHRTEHSIEFQAVMLAHVLGEACRIVPILCGSFTPGREPSQSPGDVEGVTRFLDACKTIVSERDGTVCVIAAADLAHVGVRFGDAFDIDDDVIAQVAARDHEDLAHVTKVAPAAFYGSVMKDLNQRRVCGLNCIYAALRCVEDQTEAGELVYYGYAADPAGGIVSFANVVFD